MKNGEISENREVREKSEKSETDRESQKKSSWNGKVHFSLTPGGISICLEIL